MRLCPKCGGQIFTSYLGVGATHQCIECRQCWTERQIRIGQLENALQAIAALGGNLRNDSLTDKTVPNDARQRGMMYCEARRLANEALEVES